MRKGQASRRGTKLFHHEGHEEHEAFNPALKLGDIEVHQESGLHPR